MWVVTTDQHDAITQVLETEDMALAAYEEFVTEREFAGETYRVFMAKVQKVSDTPEPWRTDGMI
ncbi:hypothetical protein A8L34_29510 [Bacillus sp. FJAT-27264]|uniref:hypothetical protein n=1 Tax=Paenibacillus sp. (strain DSM 101736 / FJAT-27264) TaxID=1850362 RepID=UPI000807DB6C|nr:hypothetical protein [Bacillus sp. FJAT-27264]OBZ15198.1 hypothetical protein A8L34_29510 [Bacillus sp. FJAT-27264]